MIIAEGTSVGSVFLDLVVKDTIEKQAAALMQKAEGILEKGFAAVGERVGKEFAASLLKGAGGDGKNLSGALEKSMSGVGKAAADSVEKSVSAAAAKAADMVQNTLGGGYSKTLEKAKSRVAALEEQFDSLGAKMDAMRERATKSFANTKDPTGNALGFLENDKAFQALERQQSTVLEKLRTAEEDLRIEQEAAAAKVADAQVREAQRATAAVQREAEKAAQAQQRVQEKAEAAAAKAAATQKREAEKAAQAAKCAQEKAAKESQAQWAKATSGITKLFKTVRRTIKATFLTAGLYAFFNAMKSMMQNAASQNRDFASALAGVKSNLATAFTPIMNAVLPALTALMQGLASATRAIASFIAAIFGQTFAQAEAAGKKLKAVASGAGGAAKAVEKANASLGIDELNVVDQNEDSRGGGGSSAAGADVIADTGKEMTGLMDKLDAFWAHFRELLAPSIEVWSAAWNQIREKALECWPRIKEAVSGLWENGLAPLLSYLFTEFVPGVLNAFSEAFAPIIGDLISTRIELFTEGFTRACALWTEAIQTIVVPALDLLLTIWTGIMDGIQSTWAAYGQPIMDGIVLAYRSVWDIIEGIWNTVLQPFFAWCIEAATDLWDVHLKPLWDNLIGFIADISMCLLSWWNNVLLPLVNWMVQTCGPYIEKAFEAIGTAVSVVVGSITDSVGVWISLFHGLLQFFTAVFQGDWEGAWNAVQNTVQSVWEGIENTVKGTVNGIIDIVNGMVSAICAGINAIIGAANKLSFDIPSWVPGIGGSHFGMNIPEITAPQIPHLAQGGYVGPNQPKLAIIGDNRREGEIVAPESKIAEAVAAGLAAGGGGAGNAELLDLLVQILEAVLQIVGKDTVLQLDGEVVGRAVQRWMQNRGASVGGTFAEAY